MEWVDVKDLEVSQWVIFMCIHMWDMCGTYVGVCACVGEQHSKLSKSPDSHIHVREIFICLYLSAHSELLFTPDSFVETEREVLGHACQCAGPWLIGLSTGSWGQMSTVGTEITQDIVTQGFERTYNKVRCNKLYFTGVFPPTGCRRYFVCWLFYILI